MNSIVTEKSILLIAIFLIVSAKPVYAITSSITDKVGLPTAQYGAPTRFGLLLHAVVLAVLYAWIAKLEGNIGSGKSEVIAAIEKHLAGENVAVFPEPLDEWGETLQLYLKNKRKWAALLALDVLRGFAKVTASRARHQVVERSPYTCRYVFCELDRNAGYVTKDELPIIEQYVELYGWTPDLILHLDVNDAVCCDRIEMRGRTGEDALTYDTIRAISFQYERMYKQHFAATPIIRCVQSKSESKDAFHARLSYLVLRAIQDSDKKAGLQHDEGR